MRRSLLIPGLVMAACAAAPPPAAQEPLRTGATRDTAPDRHASAGGASEATRDAEGRTSALRRLELDRERCALVPEDRAVVAPPCVLDLATHDLTCLLPDAAMPHFLALDPRRDAPPPGFTLSLVGPIRDVVASSTQVCVADGNGAVSCRRPGAQSRPLLELPPMTTLALGEGCGEILCGVSEASELVCVATGARAGAVRVPSVAAVSVNGCTVCMASLDGRLACFGSDRDGAPFAGSPRVIPDVACAPVGDPADRDAR